MSDETAQNGDSSQFKSLKKLNIEKERLKERKYRELYTALFRKHNGILSAVGKENAADFQEERRLLDMALKGERIALLVGTVAGVTTFASLRIFPRIFIRKYGGEEKMKALLLADEDAKKSIHGVIRQLLGILIEGSFAIWLGTRSYNLISEMSRDTYDMIAEIPLVAGRSIISENLCKEWIDVSHNTIPSAFWENVDAGTVKSPTTWRAIQKLCDSCVKRGIYEKQIRQERLIPDNLPVSLPQRVPDNILLRVTAPLTVNEVKHLTNDTASFNNQ